VESENTNNILQHVKSDATPPSSNSSVSLKITLEKTQGDDHVVDENADDVEDQGHVMSVVQDYIAVRRT